MSILKVILLAIVQGLAELLPVSSSAHVVVAEKLLHMDPSSPQMTLLLVMLHTGTMFAVIVYFWQTWKRTYFASADVFKRFAIRAIWASLLTVILGFGLKHLIEKTMFKGQPKAEIELLFGRLDLIAPALAAAGLMILIAGLMERRQMAPPAASSGDRRGHSGPHQRDHGPGWMDGHRPGPRAAVSRIFAFGHDHLRRHDDRRQQGCGGAFLLRPRRDPDSRRRRPGGSAAELRTLTRRPQPARRSIFTAAS